MCSITMPTTETLPLLLSIRTILTSLSRQATYMDIRLGSDCVRLTLCFILFLMLRDKLGRSFHAWQWCLDALSSFLGWISYGLLLTTLGMQEHPNHTHLYI